MASLWSSFLVAGAALGALGSGHPAASHLIALPNLDDDDGDGTVDWERPHARDPDIQWHDAALEPWDVVVAPRAEGAFRIWYGHEPVLGSGLPRRWTVPRHGRSRSLGVEVGDFGVRVELDVSGPGRPPARISIRSAPIVVPHPFRPVRRAWTVPIDTDIHGESNDALRTLLAAELGPGAQWIDGEAFGGDRWPQDQFEVAWAQGSDGELLRVILDSPRDGLRGSGGTFVGDVLGVVPDTVVLHLDDDDWRGYDDFGNLEVTPPLRDYPDGRVLYGTDPRDPIPPTAIRLLREHGRQNPVTIDTSWLCVGHVDEVVGFVPDPAAPRGFRLLLPSTRMGYRLLDAEEHDHRIDAYRDPPVGRDYETVTELRDDAALRDYNRALEAGPLTRVRRALDEALDLQGEEVVYVPALYAPYDDSDTPDCGAVNLVPNLVNGLLLPEESSDRATWIVPDPLLRPRGAPLEFDRFARAVQLLLPSGVDVRFVDVWEAHHRYLGGVHCATNVERAPPL